MRRREFVKGLILAGCSPAFGLTGDLDYDGRVDFEDLAILSQNWGKEDVNTFEIIYTADNHHGDVVTDPVGFIDGPQPDNSWNLGGNHFRWWRNALANHEAAADLAESDGADVFIDLGDIVDGNANDPLACLVAMIAKRDRFSGNRMNILGNHGFAVWGADLSDYFTAIDTGHVTRSSPHNDGNGDPLGWYVDINGVRFIIIFEGGTLTDMSEVQLALLEGTWLNTTNPCVILTHYHLQPNGSGWGTWSNYEAIVAILEAAGNVQLVLQAHQHLATGGNRFVNDILYCDARGSVVGPADGSEPSESDIAYYKMLVNFNAVMGTSQMRCNAQITGYGQGGSKSYETFGVF